MKLFLLTLAYAFAGSAAGSPPAHAESPTSDSLAPSNEIYQLPPVIVLGRVPSGTTSSAPAPGLAHPVSGKALVQQNVLTVREAVPLFPNTLASDGDSSHASFFSVRGAREIPWHELDAARGGVGFYVDDVPALDSYGRDLALTDVAEMEFHSSPQGTAFGVPHSMALLNLTSRAPGPDWRGQGTYQYGSEQLHQVLANVSGPLRSNLFFGLDGLFFQRDGYFKNQTTGQPFGAQASGSGKARVRWLPDENWEVDFTAGLAQHDDDPTVYVNGALPPDQFRSADHPGGFARREQNYQALRTKWMADTWQLKSITTRQDGRYRDHDPALLLEIFAPFSLTRFRDQDTTAWSQEFRAESSDPDAAWRWRTGVFLSWRDYSFIHTNLGLGADEGRHDIHTRNQDYAWYGELTHPVTEHLELSAGLRLQTTLDHSWAQFQPTPFAGTLGAVPAATDDHQDFSGVLPMVTLKWLWNSNQQTWFRFSSGLQPGGLRIPATGSTDFESEKSWHYELGHRSQFLQDRIELQATVFYTDFRNYQSFQFYPGARNIFNAAHAHAVGGELELRARPGPGLELYATAGYTEARFDDFDSSIGSFDRKRINNIPVATVALGVEAHAAWGGCGRVDWRYTGEHYFDEGNTAKQAGYWRLNARIGWERKNFGLYLFGQNLLDEGYYSQGYLFGGALAAIPGAPRTLGVEMQAKF